MKCNENLLYHKLKVTEKGQQEIYRTINVEETIIGEGLQLTEKK